MGLRDIESTLPPGFRFYPSDEELVCHYLYRKVANVKVHEGTLVEIDLHNLEPWELPESSKLSDNEWYFFSFRDRKYATGSRANRATKSGYWKATGKDRAVYNPKIQRLVGMRKTLVFYSGRAPNGLKTAWVMHEFRIENPRTPPKEDWVLCRVFQQRKGEGGSSQSQSGHSSPAMADGQSVKGECFQTMWEPHQDGANTADNLEVLHYNIFDFTPELNTTYEAGMDMSMGTVDINDYELLFDGNLLSNMGELKDLIW